MPGKADEYFQTVYGKADSASTPGISSLLDEQQFNLVLTHLPRYTKR